MAKFSKFYGTTSQLPKYVSQLAKCKARIRFLSSWKSLESSPSLFFFIFCSCQPSNDYIFDLLTLVPYFKVQRWLRNASFDPNKQQSHLTCNPNSIFCCEGMRGITQSSCYKQIFFKLGCSSGNTGMCRNPPSRREFGDHSTLKEVLAYHFNNNALNGNP